MLTLVVKKEKKYVLLGVLVIFVLGIIFVTVSLKRYWQMGSLEGGIFSMCHERNRRKDGKKKASLEWHLFRVPYLLF